MKQKRNLLVLILVFSNIITFVGLMIVSFHYSVPSKLLRRIGIIQQPIKTSKHKYNPKYSYYTMRALFKVYQPQNINIVMLGNSMTSRVDWNELLSRTDVANRGIGGDRTEGLINRLDDIYMLKPKLCFIMVGINDINSGARAKEIFEDYKIIINGLLNHNIIPIIQSTLYVSQNVKVNSEVKKLNVMLVRYANENKIDFVDINEVLSNKGSLIEELTDDGLHLLGTGYVKWRDKILPVISKYIN